MRILVISNSCFSSVNSNGRTLEKLFSSCFSSGEVAQFFVTGIPSSDVCWQFYQVSDQQALHSFLKQQPSGGPVAPKEPGAVYSASATKRKTPLKHLLREIAWKHGKWNSPKLQKWIDDFDPTHIFLFLANNTFLLDFARQISARKQVPIIAYTTEDYYFKRYNYISKRFSPLYKLLSLGLRRAYKRCAPHIRLCILNSPMLQELYAKEFSFPCACLFSKSDISFEDRSELPEGEWVVSYLGNLGLNRHKALMEIADTLNTLKPGSKLQVYGSIPENIRDEFLSNAHIDYRGFVSYEEVVSVIHDSHLLIHAEYDSNFNRKDLRAAFSTKIADSVCSGTPFFIYAPSTLTETDFVIREQCGFVATDASELSQKLLEALTEENARKQIVSNALRARESYFTAESGASLLELIEKVTP